MAESFTLQYGGRPLLLTKSETLIAVKPRSGMNDAVYKAICSLSISRATGSREMLGGFQLLELSGTPPETDCALDTLCGHASVHTASHVFHAEVDVPIVPTGNLYIKFEKGILPEQKDHLLDKSRLEIVDVRDVLSLIARTTSGSPNPIKVAIALQASDLIAVAEPELATPGNHREFRLPRPLA